MIGILFTAVLSSSTGQVPGMNPMDNNMQMLIQNGVVSPPAGSYYPDPEAGYPYSPGGPVGYGGGYGYPAFQGGSSSVGTFGLNAQAYGPSCNRGSYCRLLGTYIGPYPTRDNCSRPAAMPVAMQQCMPGGGGYPGMMGGYPGMGGFPGGMMGGGMMGSPIVLPPGYSLVADKDKDKESNKEQHADIKRQLEEIKSALEKDFKGNFEKLNDSLKQLEKRIEAGEKSGLATEADVKWLKETIKDRLYWHDMEGKLDQRIKPLEDKLREINRALEKGEMRHQQILEEWRRREMEEMKRRGEKAGAGEKNEDILRGIGAKIETMQTIVSKDIANILLKLEEFDKLLQDEKAVRSKIEERLKNLEKNLPSKDKDKDKEDLKEDKDAPRDREAPKEAAPKDKDAKDKDSIGPKNRVAQVSLSKEGVPVNKALVVVNLPADAKLYLNDQLTRAVGPQRSFLTPVLEANGTFTYALRVEVVQNGFVRTQTQQVTFRAGQRVSVSFGLGNELRVASGQQ